MNKYILQKNQTQILKLKLNLKYYNIILNTYLIYFKFV